MKSTAVTGLVLVMATSLSLAGLPPEELAALDTLQGADVPVVMHFEGRTLEEVVRAIAATGPFKVTFEGDVGEQRVSVDWGKQSLKQSLARLADEYDLALAVPDKTHLVVSRRAKKE